MKTKAMCQSTNDFQEVTILYEDGPNMVIAEKDGKKYTAVHNVFNGLYYVDDVYGEIKND